MAEGRGELEVYNQWFAAADLDRDGVLSGLEAVQFFQRSGLPQNPTLFKVWQYVAGDRPALSRQEFYTAMKLVSLAQLNGGVLDDQQALRLVNGLAGPVPLPRLQGMAVPRGIDLPAHLLPQGTPGSTAAAPGAGMPQRPPPPSPAAAQPSPARPAPAVPPASPPPAAAGAAFPLLGGEQAAAYQTAFSQLDTDRDGFVQGTDCFGAFMQSGLPKASLKQIWDLVAGDEPRLNRHQFVQALYLIDCTKRGMPVPSALPPGPFPPVAGSGSLGAMQGAPADIYSASLSIPDMVPRAVYQPQPVQPQPFASQVPALPRDRVTALDAADQLRLEGEREAALAAEAEQRKADEERVAAAAKKQFFTTALADMRLVQSKVNRAVVEAQQRCEMERAAADQMEADYNRAYAEFSMKHAQSAPLVEQLKRTQEEKAALQQKVDSLKAMVAQLEDFDPEWENREKGECERLNQEIAELTVQKERLQRGADVLEKKRGALLAQIASLKEAGGAVEGELASLQEQVDKVAAEAGKEKDAVVGLLRKLAPLYNKLYDAAKAALVPLPAEAVATMKREASPFRYDELAGAAATDWGTFKDEGFKIVSALPVDTRLSTFAAPTTAALDTTDDPGTAQPAAAAPAVAPAAEGSSAAAAGGAVADPAAPATAVSEATAEGEPAMPPLAKSSSSAAEAEAVSAAAEAGVLASAIAEALASVPARKGAAKPGEAEGAAAEAAEAQPAAEQAAAGEEAAKADEAQSTKAEAQPKAEAGSASKDANPFEVSFEDGPAGAAAETAAPLAGADAFAAFDAPTNAASATTDAPPLVKATSGAFGSSQALASESPTAAAGGTVAASADGAVAADGKQEPAASGDGGWTAF